MIPEASGSLRDEVARCMAWRPDVREELLYVRNHCFHMTLNFMIGKLAPIRSYELVLRTLIDV